MRIEIEISNVQLDPVMKDLIRIIAKAAMRPKLPPTPPPAQNQPK